MIYKVQNYNYLNANACVNVRLTVTELIEMAPFLDPIITMPDFKSLVIKHETRELRVALVDENRNGEK